MNDIDSKIVALIQQDVDSQLGTRRPAPPFRKIQPAVPGKLRSWLVPMLAAASMVGVIAGTIGVTRLSSSRAPVRPLATTASPSASSARVRLPAGPVSSAGPSTTGETTADTPGSSALTRGPSFAAIAGYYYGSTGSSGQLFVRADGASRFTGLDFTACPTCSTATAPSDTIDFSLTTLTVVKRLGEYLAEGFITAESDSADAIKLAGPVGAKVLVTIAPGGNLRLSFLPDTDVLREAAQG